MASGRAGVRAVQDRLAAAGEVRLERALVAPKRHLDAASPRRRRWQPRERPAHGPPDFLGRLGAHPQAAANLAASSPAVAANRASGGKLAAKATGPGVPSMSAMEDPILNRNPTEQRARLPAVLLDLGPEGVDRVELPLVAQALHEVEPEALRRTGRARRAAGAPRWSTAPPPPNVGRTPMFVTAGGTRPSCPRHRGVDAVGRHQFVRRSCRFAVGNPSRRPRSSPRTTSPSMKWWRPSSAAASSTRPSSTGGGSCVLDTATSLTQTGSIFSARNPNRSPSSAAPRTCPTGRARTGSCCRPRPRTRAASPPAPAGRRSPAPSATARP